MSSERIPDLNADGTPTGRYLATAPDGRLVGVPDGPALKPGWRLATREDLDAKQKLEAERQAAEAALAAPAASPADAE